MPVARHAALPTPFPAADSLARGHRWEHLLLLFTALQLLVSGLAGVMLG